MNLDPLLMKTTEVWPIMEVKPIEELSVPELPEKYYITNNLTTSTICSGLYRGFDLETGEEIIVKKCLYSQDFQREVAAFVKVSLRGENKHILPYYAWIQSHGYIVMPYMEGGRLWDLRQKKKGLSAEEAFDITAQVGKALEQVHAAGIIHNDIKSANILLTAAAATNGKLTAKLTDFGLSYCGIPGLEPDRGAGTREYAAPEKFKDSGKLTSSVDIFSLGLVIHEMLTNTLFYRENSRAIEVFPAHEKIPDKILPVIRAACEYYPENRYKSVTEMVSDLEKAVHGT